MFFSGFSLSNEKELFDQYLIENDFTISGFSYGAIKALEYSVAQSLLGMRIDLLQLFSPAYFNNTDEKYKRVQLLHFKKDQQKYIDNFLLNSGFDEQSSKKYRSNGSYDELKELLYYKWDQKKLKFLQENGTNIEVYIAQDDKIIDANKALEFFVNYSDLYLIKNKCHHLNKIL